MAHDLRKGDAALLPPGQRTHLLQRLRPAHAHRAEVLADLERRRARVHLERELAGSARGEVERRSRGDRAEIARLQKGVERRLAQVELVDVVLREPPHP